VLKPPRNFRITFQRAVGDRLFQDAEYVELVGVTHQVRKPRDTLGCRRRNRAPVVQRHGCQHEVAFRHRQSVQPALFSNNPHTVCGVIDRF